jgi:threonine dehydrogenase-like Zn-dependent dehydrogenase
LVARVRELTEGVGVDHVVEVTGALGDAVAAVARQGEIAFVGLLADRDGLAPLDVSNCGSPAPTWGFSRWAATPSSSR